MFAKQSAPRCGSESRRLQGAARRPVSGAPGAALSCLLDPHGNLDRCARETEVFAQSPLKETGDRWASRKPEENSTKRGGWVPAWVANSTLGCRPPRTGGGVAAISAPSQAFKLGRRNALRPTIEGPSRWPGSICRSRRPVFAETFTRSTQLDVVQLPVDFLLQQPHAGPRRGCPTC